MQYQKTVLTILTIFLLSFFLSGCQSTNYTFEALTLTKIASHDQVYGPREYKNLLIVYSDFECPACAYYETELNKLRESDHNVTIVYRFFPLKNIHPSATIASQAAVAAGKQGKFWEYHDQLFVNQKEWATTSNVKTMLISYAAGLSLNVTQFETDMNSDYAKALVNHYYTDAVQKNLKGTPTFFLNAKPIKFTSYEQLESLLQQ